MSTVTARATATVSAPPEQVLALLRDLQQRPRILTDNYTNFRVESDPAPADASQTIAYHFAAGGRERDYRLKVESTPDGVRERDELSSFTTTWSVSPAAGESSSVTLESSWQGAGGIGGIFERLFAPAGLRRIYVRVLERLSAAVS